MTIDNEPLNGFTGFARRDAERAQGKAQFQYSRDIEQAQQEAVVFSDEELDALGVQDRRWAWIEVDLGAIRHNTLEAKRQLRPGCRLMAVVKADGYGHGAVECARTALAAGADQLGVATVDEALQLRDAGFTERIVVLAQPPATSIPLLLAKHITPTVYTPEFALAYGETADRHNMQAPFHLAVNTGMNRIGVRFDEVVAFEQQVSFHRALVQEGTFTHFATADSDDTIDFSLQMRRFGEAISGLRSAGIDPGLVHAANSAAIYRYPEAHFDMVRLGIALYGYQPAASTRGIANLKPAMSVKARITDVRTVPVGDGVSYGLHYRSRGAALICTVPLGYADGLNRALSGRCKFILDGQYVSQVGNICMDQCMFEVDTRTSGTRPRLDPQIGDEVVIVGDCGDAVTTITEMAHALDTLEHEIAIAFSHRLPRVFV